jgi:phage terminase large subunit-like protein
MPLSLFLPEKESNGHASEVKVLPELVFKESLVRFRDILWQVTKECKRWRSGIDLGNVLDLNVLALCGRRRIMDNFGQ